MARVGVEESLTDVRQGLMEMGMDVKTLKENNDAEDCDCCVVSGQDENMMNMQGTNFQGSVVNADGATAEEVCQEVNTRLTEGQ
ncbi:YkuS family protein [Salsuginibacillus kocurii]|uniref:YkuS family protein n=1 Tax=Salsuginibacillus kocurii TaxID=427078 RepID=UPI0003783809|nr:YkuS family protein [Salsuginibacillus kocurii]